MGQAGARAIAFGPFTLDLPARRLLRGGAELPIGGRAFDVLTTLAAAIGETVTKDTLFATVWPNVVVEENNLQVQVTALRKLLGEGWIVTVPGRGYRLASAPASVEPWPAAPPFAQPPALPDGPSLAVLPFTNLGGDPDQDFFSDGIAEDILTALARDRRLFVIGRATSFSYRDAAPDLRRLGRELGVRYVLDGSVRRAGTRLRITARLNDPATALALWSERYDRDSADLFAIQDEIAAAVTAAVGLAVTQAEQQRARRKPPSDLTAWETYQRGLWHLSRRTEADAEIAIGFFRKATAGDPGFAGAWIGWSQAILMLHGNFGAPGFAEGGRAMLPLAQRAIACDPTDPEAHVALATAMVIMGDMQGAWASTREAERLAPLSSRVQQLFGILHIFIGERAEGRRRLEAATRGDPLSPLQVHFQANYSWSLFLDGDYDAVLAIAGQALRTAPDRNLWAHRHMVAALAELGRIDEARAALLRAREINAKAFDSYAETPIPWQRPEDQARFRAAYRKAGWVPKGGP